MMDDLIQKEVFDKEGHILRSYDWDYSDGWGDRLAKKLVPIIKELYVDCEGLKKNIAEIGLNDQKIKEFIELTISATIPSAATDIAPKNFQVRRADFAELIALICLEGLYKTSIPVKNIFSRELTNASSRGVDILGYEQEGNDVTLLICEVKGSSEKNSPPAVVHSGDDSMKEQLYSYVSNKQKTLNRILGVHKKASAENKLMLAKIALWWSQENISPLKVVVCPFLVRQAEFYKNTDFGFFNNNPQHFQPAKVRFLIVCIHDNIVDLSNKIYSLASK